MSLERLCEPGVKSHPPKSQGCEQTKSQQIRFLVTAVYNPHSQAEAMCTKGPLILLGSQRQFFPDLQTQDPNAIKFAGAGVAWTCVCPLSSVGEETFPGRSNTVANAAHRNL